MARYLTRQRKQLLEYLSEHTDEQMTARQVADALTAESISISAVIVIIRLGGGGNSEVQYPREHQRGVLSIYCRRGM